MDEVLAARIVAVLLGIWGTGGTLVVAGHAYSQDQLGTAVTLLGTAAIALYGAVRTFVRGRLAPTSKRAEDPRQDPPAPAPPKVPADPPAASAFASVGPPSPPPEAGAARERQVARDVPAGTGAGVNAVDGKLRPASDDGSAATAWGLAAEPLPAGCVAERRPDGRWWRRR
jgi:hypothetical protein